MDRGDCEEKSRTPPYIYTFEFYNTFVCVCVYNMYRK